MPLWLVKIRWTFIEVQGLSLQKQRREQGHFQHGEVLADAHTRVGAKGHPGTLEDVRCAIQNAFGLEALRSRKSKAT
jgi:hypothetical protein